MTVVNREREFVTGRTICTNAIDYSVFTIRLPSYFLFALDE